jgi:CheY-like chemotaxis protein
MSKVKILIIEDEKSYHPQFARILKGHNYFVEFVLYGETALKKIKKIEYDLIILDMVLIEGKMSGLETLEAIHKKNRSIPIALTSAYANDKQICEAILGQKAQTFISKPLQEVEVIQTIRNALKWKKTSADINKKGVQSIIQLYNQSIIKRCFLTNSLYCQYQIEEHTNLVFVGMPLNEKYVDPKVYSRGIEPAINSINYKSWRADEELNNIAIMCKICQKIQTARYCIFDITTWNANVMFEFGLALGTGKRSILLKNIKTQVPTDLKGFEYVNYDDNYIKLKKNLIKMLIHIIDESIPKKE